MNKELWTRNHTIALCLLVVAMVVLAIVSESAKVTAGSAPWTWYANMIALLLFLIIAGAGTTGRKMGFLIDSRNKMTLSRLQLVIWTIIILATYMSVVLARVVDPNLGYSLAFNVVLPQELWMLMGISLTSMVGSPLVLSNKKMQEPDKIERSTTLRSLAIMSGRQPPIDEDKTSNGSIIVNESPADARVADLFRGDETGNAAHLDISKIQMFYFTIILGIVYLFGLLEGFSQLVSENEAIFPVLDGSMITLLGIIHAAYLSYKTIPHSKQTK